MYDNGLEKGALGVRYLLKYLENKRLEDFNVVLNCLDEIELWLLITFFSNNIDSLIAIIPEYRLSDIFLQKELVGFVSNKKIDYGAGFFSNSTLSFKDQFKIIRNALSHADFLYQDGIISIDVKSINYKAEFDIKWLYQLTYVLLSNNRITLDKGMSDISLFSLVPIDNYSMEEFQNLIDRGLVTFFKVTSKTSNKKSIYQALNLNGINIERINFDYIFALVSKMISQSKIDKSGDLIKQVKNKFLKIENIFGNYIELELVPITITQKLVNDQEFQDISFREKLHYLINQAKMSDKVRYNSIIVFYLFKILDNIKKGSLTKDDLYILKDAYNYLLKTYANLYFSGLSKQYLITAEYLDEYKGQAHFVHARNIYKDYLKVLNRSLKDLKDNNGSLSSINYTLNEIDNYLKLLDDVENNIVFKSFNWNMRNSIIHNHIDYIDDNMRFYITGKNIRLKHFSKKTKEWEIKEFINTKPIWEMIISKNNLLKMLDDLFTKSNIEINVNISKYRKRKNYLK